MKSLKKVDEARNTVGAHHDVHSQKERNMTTEEMILEEITKRGYDARLNEVIKNGVVRKAIAVRGEGNCAPNIYIEGYVKEALEGRPIQEIGAEILRIAKEHDGINFDTELMENKDFIMSHVLIAIQKASQEKLLKRDCGFEGLESYLYLRVRVEGEEGSIKLNEVILRRAGISEEEIWEQAEMNLQEETVIQPIVEVVKELSAKYSASVDCPGDMVEMIPENERGIYVISNKAKHYGASAILDKGKIKEFAEKCGVRDFIVIPSSKHEMLLVPDYMNISFEDVCSMVKEINETMVKEEDRLTDTAYRLTA